MEFLPFPRKDHGWLAGVVLAVVFFTLYYAPFRLGPFHQNVSLYDRLAVAYRNEFYTSRTLTPSCPHGDASCYDDYKVTILIPQSVTTLVEQELIVSVENRGDHPFDLSLVADFDLGDSEGVSLVMGSEAKADASADSSNILDFGLIPPRATITRQLWIKVILSDQFSDKAAKVNGIEFYFWPTVNEQQSQDRVRLRGSAHSELDQGKSLAQSFVRNLLLPPWSNGLLLLIAVLIPALWEELYDIGYRVVQPAIRTIMQKISFFRRRNHVGAGRWLNRRLRNGQLHIFIDPIRMRGGRFARIDWFHKMVRWLTKTMGRAFFFAVLLFLFCLINGFFLQKTLLVVAAMLEPEKAIHSWWPLLWLLVTALVVVIVKHEARK